MPYLTTTIKSKTSTIYSKGLAFSAGLFLALMLCLVFFVPEAKSTEVPVAPPPVAAPSLPSQVDVMAQYRKTLYHKRRADHWAHRRGVHYRLAHRVLRPPTSLAYEQWRTGVWRGRELKQRRLYILWRNKQRQMASANKNFHLALQLASARFRVSYRWLHDCAHTEGHVHGYRWRNGVALRHLGLDPFWMNNEGSKAGGHMQFMHSTFKAYPQARTSIPRQYRQWNDRLGQAMTAAYVFRTSGSGQWTGSGCRRH